MNLFNDKICSLILFVFSLNAYCEDTVPQKGPLLSSNGEDRQVSELDQMIQPFLELNYIPDLNRVNEFNPKVKESVIKAKTSKDLSNDQLFELIVEMGNHGEQPLFMPFLFQHLKDNRPIQIETKDTGTVNTFADIAGHSLAKMNSKEVLMNIFSLINKAYELSKSHYIKTLNYDASFSDSEIRIIHKISFITKQFMYVLNQTIAENLNKIETKEFQSELNNLNWKEIIPTLWSLQSYKVTKSKYESLKLNVNSISNLAQYTLEMLPLSKEELNKILLQIKLSRLVDMEKRFYTSGITEKELVDEIDFLKNLNEEDLACFQDFKSKLFSIFRECMESENEESAHTCSYLISREYNLFRDELIPYFSISKSSISQSFISDIISDAFDPERQVAGYSGPMILEMIIKHIQQNSNPNSLEASYVTIVTTRLLDMIDSNILVYIEDASSEDGYREEVNKDDPTLNAAMDFMYSLMKKSFHESDSDHNQLIHYDYDGFGLSSSDPYRVLMKIKTFRPDKVKEYGEAEFEVILKKEKERVGKLGEVDDSEEGVR